MLLFNGANLYQQIGLNSPGIMTILQSSLIALFCMYLIKYRLKGVSIYPTMIIGFLLISTVIVRFFVGGVGLQVLLEYGSHVFLVFLAIIIDKNKFLDRLLRVIIFFAAISIIGYVVQLFAPGILQSVLSSHATIFNESDWSTGRVVWINKRVWGLLFFSMRDGELQRNIGIFTEPANYQIVLNVAIYILLFLRKYINFHERIIKKYFVLISIALITCRSTSGYVVYFAILSIYILSKDKTYSSNVAKKTSMKRSIMMIAILGVMLLGIDFIVNGQESLVYLVAISKLFGNSGQFDLNAGSGYYRMVTIESCIDTMIRHPLGVGYDVAHEITKSRGNGAAGGVLFTFGAAYGLIPFIIVLIWDFFPIIKSRDLTFWAKALFIFVFIEISMAQSKVFYPLLLAVPLYLYICNNSLNDDAYDTEVMQ